MSNAIARLPDQSAIENVVIKGDLKDLSPEQRVAYYNRVCDVLGLNNMTQPFSYLTLNGKTVLYANKSCTDQLRRLYGVSINIVSREYLRDDGLYVVTARASIGDRTDESIGAVSIKSKQGDDLANALMKGETKAKRRATLSICGLAMLDETEVESISGASRHDDTPSLPANQTPPPRPRLITEAERKELADALAEAGGSWEKMRDWLNLSAEERMEAMTEPLYLRAMNALRNTIAKKKAAAPQPQREPGDPDPDEQIDEASAKGLKRLFEQNGGAQKWGEFVVKLGAAPGTTYDKLTVDQYVKAVELLKKKG